MANPVVVLETTKGTIRARLDAEKAPITVENFLNYARSGHYNGTIFHRVIPNFMIQGGGLDSTMREKRGGAPIKNEAGNGLTNRRGTLAMARTNVVDSATSQFFINVKDNAALNHQDTSARGFGYAVFGEVIEGMDVVDSIVSVPTGNKGMHSDVPLEPVVINSVTVEESE